MEQTGTQGKYVPLLSLKILLRSTFYDLVYDQIFSQLLTVCVQIPLLNYIAQYGTFLFGRYVVVYNGPFCFIHCSYVEINVTIPDLYIYIIGHDTTSHSLAHCLYELAINPVSLSIIVFFISSLDVYNNITVIWISNDW